MTKSIKKKPSYNLEALDVLQKRFGFSKDYIRKSLRGDRKGIIPDKLKEEYNRISKKLEGAVKDLENENL